MYMNNTKTLAIVAILTAATLVIGVTFAASAYADSSTTNTEIKNSQKAIASGIKPNVQNCAQNNIDTQFTTGDEGVDCHNQRDENSNQTGTD
jgi:hypothetical protein